MTFKHTIELSRKDVEKGLKFPAEMSPELAEIIGIHFGDGCMTHHKTTHRILYSFNSRDKLYVDYVSSLFWKIFNISMKRMNLSYRNEIELYFISKSMCLFLNEVLLVPFSPKKDLKIPEYIINNPEYLKNFIRGLFDTDGCFTIQRDGKYSYHMVKICTGSESFAVNIDFALKSLDMKSYICRKETGFDVVVKRKESYEKFLLLIKPQNARGNRYGDAGTFALMQA
jgi:DNA-binding transcriptional regulator WhiA